MTGASAILLVLVLLKPETAEPCTHSRRLPLRCSHAALVTILPANVGFPPEGVLEASGKFGRDRIVERAGYEVSLCSSPDGEI